jgi:hypothetical protein
MGDATARSANVQELLITCARSRQEMTPLRDFLEMSGMDQCDWKFVEAKEIPEGPWKYRDNSKLVLDADGSTN